MGARGPAKKPAAAHKRAGTFRADRHAAPELPKATPAKPRGMPKAAAAAWDRIVPQLEATGFLAAVDGEALRQLAEATADYERAGVELEEFGLLVTEETAHGATRYKLNPAWTARKDSRAAIVGLLGRFGMTPSGRTGLGAKDEAGGMSAELAAILGVSSN